MCGEPHPENHAFEVDICCGRIRSKVTALTEVDVSPYERKYSDDQSTMPVSRQASSVRPWVET